MKCFIIFIFSVLFIGCNHKSNQQHGLEVVVDTVFYQQHFKDIRFNIDNSSYPQVKGMDDEVFQKRINDIFYSNFSSYMDSAKAEAKDLTEFMEAEAKSNGKTMDEEFEYMNESIGGVARASFEILTNNDQIFSIVQYFVIEGVGGGNNWYPSSVVVNCDLKNKKILSNTDINVTEERLDFINWKIEEYFYGIFYESGINYPFIEKKSFNESNFGIRNDSIVLVTQAYPTSHSSFATYIIPIGNRNDEKKMENGENFEEFLCRFCNDESFQLTRVKFPVGKWMVPIEGPCPENDTSYVDDPMSGCLKLIQMDEKNWEYITLRGVTTFECTEYRTFGRWVDKSDSYMRYESGWIDSDLSYYFVFEKKDKKWFLTSRTEYPD